MQDSSKGPTPAALIHDEISTSAPGFSALFGNLSTVVSGSIDIRSWQDVSGIEGAMLLDADMPVSPLSQLNNGNRNMAQGSVLEPASSPSVPLNFDKVDFNFAANSDILSLWPPAEPSRNYPYDPAPAIPRTLKDATSKWLSEHSLAHDEQNSLAEDAASLWRFWIENLSPFSCAMGHTEDNPFIKYATKRAQKQSDVLHAVLFLTMVIKGRSDREMGHAVDAFVHKTAADVLQRMDEGTASAQGRGSSNMQFDEMLQSFTTLVVFCMGFVAKQDTNQLVMYLEHASIVCHGLFCVMPGNEEFLYLAKILGYLQTMLFYSYPANMDFPDYLTAAMEATDYRSPAVWAEQGNGPWRFQNIDPVSGLDPAMAGFLYTLGSLMRRRRCGLEGDRMPEFGQAMRSFQADAQGLEARLRRHHAHLRSHRPEEATNGRDKNALRQYMDSYNTAIFWSSWAIFTIHVKEYNSKDADDVAEVDMAVSKILDACAEVPKSAAISEILLFPLMVAATMTSKLFYREYIIDRLESMTNKGLTNRATGRLGTAPRHGRPATFNDGQ
ncbi:hypothetical protein Sste5344_006282 [Sporothrix stenoceras]